MKVIKLITAPDWGREIMLMEEHGHAFVRLYWYNGDEKDLYIECLSVDLMQRRKGFATEILKVAEQTAETLGARCISLSVKKDTWTYEWYIRKGFNWFAWDRKTKNTVWLRKTLKNY